MRYLLALDTISILEQLAWSNALIIFDFEGTLVPAGDEHEMRARTATAFRRLCALYPCAVISGRARRDLRKRLHGADVKYIVGKHGLDPGPRLLPSARARSKLPADAAPNPSETVVALREAAQADVALYLGERAADERVFELDQPGRLFAARIGRSRSSAAKYYLKSQSEVDRLISKLVSFRLENAKP